MIIIKTLNFAFISNIGFNNSLKEAIAGYIVINRHLFSLANIDESERDKFINLIASIEAIIASEVYDNLDDFKYHEARMETIAMQHEAEA